MDVLHGASTAPKPPPSAMKPMSRPNLRPASLPFSATTAISIFALVSPFRHPYEVKAITLPKEQLISKINDVESAIDHVQELSLDLLDTSRHIFGSVTNTLSPFISAGVPILRESVEQVLNLASSAVSQAFMKALEVLQSSGFDTGPILSAAQLVLDSANQITKIIVEGKPVVDSIASADPALIAVTTESLFLTYILFPPIWSFLSYKFRGYKGELSAAQTLDLISTKKYFLIDIRLEKDKRKAGVPFLPSSTKNKFIAIPLEELPENLRGIVRNAKKVEAEMTALKISYLKKISKSSSIVIMDSYSNSAKMVAISLTNLGYKKSWIVGDGFSGRRGWVQSRLGTESYDLSFAEVVSPTRVIPATLWPFGTSNSRASSPQKLLP